jgi:hypothetical protein
MRVMKITRVEHVAIAVQSLTQSIDLLKNTFGLSLEYEEQIGQTRPAMLPVGETYIERLEGQGPESGVSKWMSDHGPGLLGVEPRDETPRHRPRRRAHRLHRSARHWQCPDRAGGAAGRTRRVGVSPRSLQDAPAVSRRRLVARSA